MFFVDKIKPIVEKAGKFVLSHFHSEVELAVKLDGSIVTEVDIACERLLKKELSLLLPDSGFLTEESEEQKGNEYRWIIDPIDGTKNFISAMPYFCIAIALEKHGEVIASVTYAPALQEWFYAEKGQGMYWNDKKIFLEGDYWKKRAPLIIMQHSHFSKSKVHENLKKIGLSSSYRYYGATALDLGYIAAGSIDALILESVNWWDVAGGFLMVKEAGGCVVNLDGGGAKKGIQSIYVGKKELYDLLFDKNNSF